MNIQNKNRKTRNSNLLQESGATTLGKRKLQSPTPEQIQQRAYEIHQVRGGAPGQELDDWLQAERELKAEAELGPQPEGDSGGLEQTTPPHH